MEWHIALIMNKIVAIFSGRSTLPNCQAGVYKFSPVGAYQTSITLSDESGCELPSKARVLAAEKHGYTRPVEVDWPIAEQP